tara:strand:+ start:376 stop:543 length:168 start_codon:yes stop_codon:yes gene_type:complete
VPVPHSIKALMVFSEPLEERLDEVLDEVHEVSGQEALAKVAEVEQHETDPPRPSL